MGVRQALEIARALDPEAAPDLCLVTVSIEPPDRYREGLSDEVAAAVPEAVAAIVELLEGRDVSRRAG